MDVSSKVTELVKAVLGEKEFQIVGLVAQLQVAQLRIAELETRLARGASIDLGVPLGNGDSAKPAGG